jgi:hypothetical protein
MTSIKELVVVIKHKCLKIHLYIMSLFDSKKPLTSVPPEVKKEPEEEKLAHGNYIRD